MLTDKNVLLPSEHPRNDFQKMELRSFYYRAMTVYLHSCNLVPISDVVKAETTRFYAVINRLEESQQRRKINKAEENGKIDCYRRVNELSMT